MTRIARGQQGMEIARSELSDGLAQPVEGALATSSIGSSNGSRSMNSPVNAVRNGPTFSEKIDRHEWSQLGCQRYVREYVDPLKPVVITGALEHWPARSKWTFDFLQDHYGQLSLEVDGRQLSMAQLIAEVCASTPHAPAPAQLSS